MRWHQHRSARTERLIEGLGGQHPLGDGNQIRSTGALNPRRDRRGKFTIAGGKLLEHNFRTALRYVAAGKFALIFIFRGIHRCSARRAASGKEFKTKSQYSVERSGSSPTLAIWASSAVAIEAARRVAWGGERPIDRGQIVEWGCFRGGRVGFSWRRGDNEVRVTGGRLVAGHRVGETLSMTIKVLMVDVDGVIVVHPEPHGWSVNLERDLGLSRNILQSAFFERHFNDVVHGRAALRERLAPVLQKIAPHLTCDRLIDYWFARDSNLNLDLLQQLGPARRDGLKLHLATVQEHERADYLWRKLGLKEQFDAIHYAADLGWAKPAPQFFAEVEQRCGFAPNEIFFIDDKVDNVEAARNCGWGAAVWTGKNTLEELLLSKPEAREG